MASILAEENRDNWDSKGWRDKFRENGIVKSEARPPSDDNSYW